MTITWLTQTQAAERLGVSWRTVHRRVKDRKLAHSTDPATGHPRIAVGDLEAYMTANYRPARYSRQRTPMEVAA